jgi:alpha-L-rhamnosidase
MTTDPTFALPLPRRLWWPWAEPAELVCFERSFNLSEPAEARLYVSASGGYTAQLDGQALDVPDALLPSWRSMHVFSVQLTTGQHRLAFEVQAGGHSQPFLLACLDWTTGGAPARLASDATWRMARGPLANLQSANARTAWAFDGVWAEPWGFPCNAPLDFCRLSTGWQQVECQPLVRLAGLQQGLVTQGAAAKVLPGAALWFRPAWLHAFQPPSLENKRPRLEWYRTREAHSLINNTWLDLFEPRAPHAVLDVGEETFARLRVTVRSGGPAVLALTTGESLNEVQRYARRVTDIISLRDGESFTTAPTGFRYVKVMALSADPDGPGLELEPIMVQHIRYPLAQRGSFACSDALLGEVWTLSERTVHLCMQNEVWDGIKRDQLPWMGDLYTEALAIYHLFGDGQLVRRTLETLAEIGPAQPRPLARQTYPGLVAIWKSGGSSHPGANSGDINGIPSYTLWWILGLADYALYTGDDDLVASIAAELAETLEHVRAWVGEDGVWRFRGGWDFIDWSPVPRAEREVFCHLLACLALRLGADLLERAGQSLDSLPALRETQTRMAEAARREWWRDGASLGVSHQINAMMIRSGVLSQPEAISLFANTLAADPPYAMTYWHRYLDLEAAARVGQVEWGLAYIRKHWGLSLQLGLSTLWEAFDPSWVGPDPHAVSMVGGEYARYGGYETSLCHGWSAGPAIWLHQAVLGVRPLSPGFATVDFQPNLGDLDWAKGQIPTPRGLLGVSLYKDSEGARVAELSVPPGVSVNIDSALKSGWQIRPPRQA